jgi:biotin carboxylase
VTAKADLVSAEIRKMKKLLLLGGSTQQIVAIETAKRLGYYTILCDYLPDNPGQHHADCFYLVSTTDKDAVLEVARNEHIDGILAYASDPAAPTAAYVAEKLGLPGNPYRSVEILCNKDLFRAFLSENGFCTPKAKAYSCLEEVVGDLYAGYFSFPVILKPVDSSGSKGVARIDDLSDLENKLSTALRYSRCKRLIVEEWVEKYGYQIAGDGLSINGELVFRLFGNDHFDPNGINTFVPVSASFPYNMPEWIHEKIHGEIQRLITLLHMGNCTYNFDIRIDKDFNVYLMEIAPRDGGNYIPQVIKHLTGVDLVEYSVRMAMGESVHAPKAVEPNGFAAYYAVHSNQDGILAGVNISEDFYKEHILESFHIKQPGAQVKAFRGANTALGCYLMRFDSMEQMLEYMDHGEKWIKVNLY